MRLCTECGNEIPAKRLAAKPNAYKCVECQSKVDVVYHEPVTHMEQLGIINVQGRNPATGQFVTHGWASLFSSEDYKTGTAHNTFLYTVSDAGHQGWADEQSRRRAA